MNITPNTIKLYEFIPREDISFKYPIAEEIPVPTEFVVKSVQICTPSFARVFRTGFYLLRNEIVDYKTLYEKENERFKGTSHYDEVFLVEVWVDCGDDGHVCFRHVGYRFVPESLLKNERKYSLMEHYTGALPNCMHWLWEGNPYPIDQWEKDKAFMEEHLT